MGEDEPTIALDGYSLDWPIVWGSREGERMSASLFAYGTLQIPEVIEKVTGRSWKGMAAMLTDYACFRLRGKPYPGVIAWPGCVTPGLLYVGIDPQSLEKMDRFEGDSYRRRAVDVTSERGHCHRAFAFVIPPECRQTLSEQPWDKQQFVERSLSSFLATVGVQSGS